MCKYLFLGTVAHANTWIEGGRVPINPARKYLSIERMGTATPDEVIQKETTGGSLKDLPGVQIRSRGVMKDIIFTNCSYNGVVTPGPITYSQHPEDALILCMSNSFDPEIMRRLGKSACVKIPDVHALRTELDRQVGCESKYGDVGYTDDPGERSHFLKGMEDSWQQEYRLVWIRESLGTEEFWVTLPSGLASRFGA